MTGSLSLPHPPADAPGIQLAAGIPDRTAVVAIDSMTSERLEVGTVWTELSTGRWCVRDHFATGSRLYFVVEPQDRPSAPPEIELLQRTLLGEQQKVVALDTARSPSTITNRLGVTLARMGLPPRPARAPVLLAASAAAAHKGTRLPHARVTRWVESSGRLHIISVARFDDYLEAVLTAAEWNVARLVMDGYSHREIAKIRACSVRTVANQIGSIFRKLHVSGRAEFLLHAVSASGEGCPSDAFR